MVKAKPATKEVKSIGKFTFPGLCMLKTREKPTSKAGKKEPPLLVTEMSGSSQTDEEVLERVSAYPLRFGAMAKAQLSTLVLLISLHSFAFADRQKF